jgi:hypothetical protein
MVLTGYCGGGARLAEVELGGIRGNVGEASNFGVRVGHIDHVSIVVVQVPIYASGHVKVAEDSIHAWVGPHGKVGPTESVRRVVARLGMDRGVSTGEMWSPLY